MSCEEVGCIFKTRKTKSKTIPFAIGRECNKIIIKRRKNVFFFLHTNTETHTCSCIIHDVIVSRWYGMV